MDTREMLNEFAELKGWNKNKLIGWSEATDFGDWLVKNCSIHDVSNSAPLTKEHQCFERGHAFYLVCEIDNGRSKYGEHKCSRCGHVEPFQYDYGSW